MSENETKIVTPCAFIDDGYTLDLDIPEVPGVHQALFGKYRPMTNREVKNCLDAQEQARKAEPPKGKTREDIAEQKQNEAVAAHIIEWTLQNRDGESVPISAASVERIYPGTLQAKLVRVVMGLPMYTRATDQVFEILLTDGLTATEQADKIRDVLIKAEQPQAGDNVKN